MAINRNEFISPGEALTLDGLFRERVRRTPDSVAYRDFNAQHRNWRDYTWAHIDHQVARWHRLSRADFVAGPSGAPAFLTHPEHSFAFAIFEWVHRSRAPPVAGRLFCRLRFAGRPCATCAG